MMLDGPCGIGADPFGDKILEATHRQQLLSRIQGHSIIVGFP